MALLRHSDYRGRRMRPDEIVLERFAMSPAGTWYLMHVAPRFDRAVIPRTNGRLSSMGIDKIGLVTTTGAKSGKPRTGPLALIHFEGDLLAIGSNYGRESHPAWSANLLADPDCEIEYQGPTRPYRARLLEGEERARAWATATDFYPGYDRYKERCAPREIRVFRLTPRDAATG
jgi:deazaflavin-dependent oxidoreductase (nitroreductase family)